MLMRYASNARRSHRIAAGARARLGFGSADFERRSTDSHATFTAMPIQPSRRAFIKQVGLAGATLALAPRVRASSPVVGGQKLRVAFIGVNGNGASGRRTIED